MTRELNNILKTASVEVRNENIARIFKQNKRILTLVLAIAISGSICFTAYKINNKIQQEKFSEMLHQSMIDQQIGEIEKSKTTLKKIHESSSAPNGIKSLASLRYAGILIDEDKKEEALNVYKQINNCRFCDAYIKDLSALLMVRTILTDESLFNKAEFVADLEKIENKAKILRYYIAEQRGYLELNKNNFASAYKIFEMIAKNPDVKEALKNRASDAMKIVIQKGYDPKSS
ncbi:MAG: hypothetical protein ACKO46_01235 [Alphaproteobacteria bacterium]